MRRRYTIRAVEALSQIRFLERLTDPPASQSTNCVCFSSLIASDEIAAPLPVAVATIVVSQVHARRG